jgi:16S rRNA (cytosine967-C5)-methyltransferase
VPSDLAEKARTLDRLVGPLDPTEASDSAPCSLLSAPCFRPAALLPAWFAEHCPAAFTSPHLDALNNRASVWVRIQSRDRNLVLDEFRARQWTWEQPADFPDALGLPPNAEVANTDAYRRGFVEIQDLGSQLVLATAPVVPGTRWLDACAGAGGKSLQLARMVGDEGHVDATDIRPEILEELRERAQRARIDNVRIVSLPVTAGSPPDNVVDRPGALRAPRDDNALYDGVLVDAPCSGSGTWRRQPHLKWCAKPETIATFAKIQREILELNAPRVKPGGLLIYATCSLSHHENQDVASAFLAAHPEFQAEPPADNHGGTFDGVGTTLLPGTRNTDGFYAAILRRVS